MKIAIIYPLYKNNNKQLIYNYRIITDSLLKQIYKIIETNICNRLSIYI